MPHFPFSDDLWENPKLLATTSISNQSDGLMADGSEDMAEWRLALAIGKKVAIIFDSFYLFILFLEG